MAARKDFGQKRGGRGASRAAPKKAAGNSPAAQPPAPRSTPWIRIALSLAMLGGMGYLLYSLTQVDTPSSTTAAKKPAPVASKVERSSEKAQETVDTAESEERFDFYKMLPESEVETEPVTVYKSTPKDAKTKYKYLLQAGSFRSAADAERMRAKLILLGLPNAKTSKSTGQNGTWYRVRVGPFDNRSLLNRAHDKLVRQQIQPMEIKLK